MIYVFNKNKILSYIVASSIVLMFFVFQSTIIPNDDVQLVKVSSNITNDTVGNNINNVKNNYYAN